jgi:polyisoprenoid-binding protein YceI
MHLKHISVSIAAALMLGSFAYAGDTYKVDPAHTSVTFSVRHLGINNVKGQFKEFAGEILMVNEAVTGASGTIQVKSVDTGVQKRDDHLRTADFFDAANYPTITFKTKRVEKSNAGQITLVADFTMRGITKELRLPVKLSGPTKDPWGGVRIGLEAKTKLNRKQYGIKYHELLETGVLAVGEEVELEINAEAIKESPSKSNTAK